MGATGERWNDELGERNGECSSESVREGGRSKIGDDVGDPAVLRRAAISRKAATEMRWEVSEAVLPLRGRGRTGGSRGVDSEESAEGDSGRMCRNDLRLNEESSLTSRVSSGGATSPGLDFLRSRCAHANSPPGFFGAGETSVVVRRPSVLLRGGSSALLGSFEGGVRASAGSDRVERAL